MSVSHTQSREILHLEKNIMGVQKKGKKFRLFVKYLDFLMTDSVVHDFC